MFAQFFILLFLYKIIYFFKLFVNISMIYVSNKKFSKNQLLIYIDLYFALPYNRLEVILNEL